MKMILKEVTTEEYEYKEDKMIKLTRTVERYEDEYFPEDRELLHT